MGKKYSCSGRIRGEFIEIKVKDMTRRTIFRRKIAMQDKILLKRTLLYIMEIGEIRFDEILQTKMNEGDFNESWFD